jgi:hypothetical protein
MGVRDVQMWLRGLTTAQTIHRDNLGDTSSNGGIMHREGLSAATLQAAPQLAKVLVQEQALAKDNAPKPQNYIAPPSLGPGSISPMPGLGNLVPRTPRTSGDGQE